jgi:hypothetical protein
VKLVDLPAIEFSSRISFWPRPGNMDPLLCGGHSPAETAVGIAGPVKAVDQVDPWGPVKYHCLHSAGIIGCFLEDAYGDVFVVQVIVEKTGR